MRRILILLCSVALLQLVAFTDAEAGPTPHMMLGRWPGFALADGGIDNPDYRGPLAFNVFNQDGRRFSATFTFGRTEFALEGIVLEGSLAENDEVTMTGAGAGVRVVVTGRLVTPLEERGGVTPCVLVGRYLLAGPAGTERGRLVAAHLTPDPAAPFLGGHWMGEATGVDNPDFRAPLLAELTQGREGDLGGMLQLGDSTFEIAGGLSSHDRTTPDGERAEISVVLVGGGRDGLLLAAGIYTPATDTRGANIEGNLRWLRAVGSEVDARFGVNPCA